MKFTDRLLADGLKRTADGYAAISARVARGGNVQAYEGREVGDERRIVRVYRPAEEVFRLDAIKTYAGVPVTLGHPDSGVNSENWKDLAVGEVGEDVLRDGEFVRVPILLRDANAIAAVEGGARELSMGYDAQITMQDGVSPSGEAYDAVMSDFRMNHVAIVPVARGGAELRIGDGAKTWGASPLTDAGKEVSMTLRKIMVDGLEVETTDAGAAAIAKLTAAKDAADQKLTAAAAAHDKAIAAKDAELAKKDAEITDLKAKVLDAAAIDALVKDRADLVAKAKAIHAETVTDGKTAAEIKRAVVTAKRGDMTGKSEAYVDAAFDLLVEDAGDDPVKKALADAEAKDGGDIYAKRDASLSTAWQKGAK
jgi:hypothetical protein